MHTKEFKNQMQKKAKTKNSINEATTIKFMNDHFQIRSVTQSYWKRGRKRERLHFIAANKTERKIQKHLICGSIVTYQAFRAGD